MVLTMDHAREHVYFYHNNHVAMKNLLASFQVSIDGGRQLWHTASSRQQLCTEPHGLLRHDGELQSHVRCGYSSHLITREFQSHHFAHLDKTCNNQFLNISILVARLCQSGLASVQICCAGTMWRPFLLPWRHICAKNEPACAHICN